MPRTMRARRVTAAFPKGQYGSRDRRSLMTPSHTGPSDFDGTLVENRCRAYDEHRCLVERGEIIPIAPRPKEDETA